MLDLTTLLKCWSWPGLSSELDQEEVQTLAASSLWQIDISSEVSPALTLLCQTAQLGVYVRTFLKTAAEGLRDDEDGDEEPGDQPARLSHETKNNELH